MSQFININSQLDALRMKEFDTICAIATALGEGGIAIIRI